MWKIYNKERKWFSTISTACGHPFTKGMDKLPTPYPHFVDKYNTDN
jgi:hypothetical protein